MATMGQIIYNLEDYNTSNGYISTRRADSTVSGAIVYSKDYFSVTDAGEVVWDEAGYYSEVINIYQDVVKYDVSKIGWQKMGIQAPSGTRFMINDDREILVGRTGVYELDENIIVTKLSFIQPKNYIYDKETSDQLLNKGKEEIDAAELARKDAMEELDPDAADYYEKYQEIQEIYAAAYEKALSKYNRGINGVYTLPDPDNENNELNYKKLYNIIIDYVTE